MFSSLFNYVMNVPQQGEYEVVVLDFDGVVVESNDIKHRAVAEIFRPYREHYDEIMVYHRGHNAVNRFIKFRYIQENILGTAYDEELSARWAEQFVALTRKAIIGCPFVPGAQEFLRYFFGRLPLYLASATPHEELALILEARKLTGYFKDFFGAPKSKAQSFTEIARWENVKPQQILFIGDSAEDHRTAVSFGCRFLARRSDHNTVDTDVLVFADLENMLKALKSSSYV